MEFLLTLQIYFLTKLLAIPLFRKHWLFYKHKWHYFLVRGILFRQFQDIILLIIILQLCNKVLQIISFVPFKKDSKWNSLLYQQHCTIHTNIKISTEINCICWEKFSSSYIFLIYSILPHLEGVYINSNFNE